MNDLVDWYNAAEQEGKLSPVELAALFHYRYINLTRCLTLCEVLSDKYHTAKGL